MDDPTIEVIARRGLEQAWLGTAFDIHRMKGAYGRVAEDATPFPNRSARFWLNVYGFWTDPADDAADMEPHASGGAYVNFLGQEGGVGDAGSAAHTVYGPAKSPA